VGRPRQPDVRDLLGRTLLADPRQRVDAVRELTAVLGERVEVPDPDDAWLVDDGWDRVLELAADPDATVRRTVLHALAAEAPPERRADVDRALGRLGDDEDDALRRRARKVHAQFRRLRAA
jgi:hypothetical protein